MKRLATPAALVLVAVASVSCGDDDDGPGQFRYPMEVGLKWYYSQTWYEVDADSAVEVLSEGKIVVSVTEVDSLSQLGNATRVDIEYDDGSHVSNGSDYYQNRDEGLYRVGYCGESTLGAPKSIADAIRDPIQRLPFGGFMSIGDDRCDGPWTIEAEGRLVLPYPIRTGYSWVFLGSSPFEIDKQIAGWSYVTVPAGKWPSYRVRWTYPSVDQAEISDDIAAVGLIRREVISRHVQVMTPEHPYGTGEFVDRFDLIVLDSLKP